MNKENWQGGDITKCMNSPEKKAKEKRFHELNDIYKKTQAYKAYEQAEIATTLEINATCKLFLDGVYDIDKAFEKIAKATYKLENAIKSLNTPQYKALSNLSDIISEEARKCNKFMYPSQYYDRLKAYKKALEAAKKALESLQTAFRNSQEVKEYVAECRGITFSAYKDMKDFDFKHHWNWIDWEEEEIISYIQSIIANRP